MNKEKKLQAQLVIVTGLLVLYFIFSQPVGFIYAAVILGVGFLISQKFADAVLWLWFKLAEMLGWINSRIILGVIFYIFLFPIAVLYRLFNRDPLAKKRAKRNTMYKVRDHTYQKTDLENMW